MPDATATMIFEELYRIGQQPDYQDQLHHYCESVLSAVENAHFDYKAKGDATRPELEESDKRNLCKAISGFANTSGGVLIWGVDGGPPLQLKPIQSVEPFLKNLLELAGVATEPSVPGVTGCVLKGSGSSAAGVAAVLVPESEAPPAPRNLSIGMRQRVAEFSVGAPPRSLGALVG